MENNWNVPDLKKVPGMYCEIFEKKWEKGGKYKKKYGGAIKLPGKYQVLST